MPRLLLLLTLPFLLGARELLAQREAPAPAGPRTLSGIVTDTLGNPLEDVSVFVSELRRITRTRAGGRFRFDSVPEGRYAAHSSSRYRPATISCISSVTDTSDSESA